MLATLARRGPDDSATWTTTNAALGVRRLAVIDLVGGQQPMVREVDGRSVALAYTGELFNTAEVRSVLMARGHLFRTSSDTEVVLRAFIEWGRHCVEHFRGMFAFAVWDERDNSITLLRDRFGIYPLFYAVVGDELLFASEMKAILAHPRVTAVVDADGLRGVLGMMRPRGWTPFRGIVELPPAYGMRWNNGRTERWRYWQLDPAPHCDDLSTTIGTVRDLVVDAIERQLVADVPVGIMLSGGLDSAVIAAVAVASGRLDVDAVRTYSVAFDSRSGGFAPDAIRSTPDGPFALEMATHLATLHRDVVLSPDALNADAAREAVLRSRDMPSPLSDTDTSFYLLCETMRRDCTVALCGEAADEIFGGYPWFFDPRCDAPGLLPWREFARSLTGPHRLRDGGLIRPDVRVALDFAGLESEIANCLRVEAPLAECDPTDANHNRQMMYLNLVGYLPVPLERKDRIGMAAGLEGRVPFLDHPLVEYLYNVPAAFKSFDGREKALLRAAFADVIPTSIRDRRKAGYPPVVDPRYDALLRERLSTLASDDEAPARQLLDMAALDRYLADPAEDDDGHINRCSIDMMLAFDAWLRDYAVRLEV
jgi:asparagine synthase (glutamine-hydrolysing)